MVINWEPITHTNSNSTDAVLMENVSMRKLVVNGEVVAVINNTRQIVVVDDETLNLGDYLAGTLDSNLDYDGIRSNEWLKDTDKVSILLDYNAKVVNKDAVAINSISVANLAYNIAVCEMENAQYELTKEELANKLNNYYGISKEEALAVAEWQFAEQYAEVK